MRQIPSLEALYKECADVIDNQAVTKISRWTDPNTDKQCDEQAYRNRGIANAEKLNAKLEEVLSFE